MWGVAKPLRPHPLSVGQARNFCRRRLSSVLEARAESRVGADALSHEHMSEVVDDAATIASELVTNAVKAGSSQIELSLQLRASSVFIEVVDNAAGAVRPASPSATDTQGRGLLVVAALSREWGVAAGEDAKTVWAEVDLSRSSGTA